MGRSVMDLITLYISVVLIIGDSILWNSKTRSLTPIEVMTSFEGKFCVFLHHYGAPSVAIYSLILNSYGRKEPLRKFIKLVIGANLADIKDWYNYMRAQR